jgi:hypothetical protein
MTFEPLRPERISGYHHTHTEARPRDLSLTVVLVFMPIVLAYTVWVFHVLRGRITLESVRQHTGL